LAVQAWHVLSAFLLNGIVEKPPCMQAEWRIHLLFTAPRARCRGKVCWFTSADRARLSNASLFVDAPSSQRGAPTMTCRSARSVTPAAIVVRTRHGALGLAWPEPVRCVGMPCGRARQTDRQAGRQTQEKIAKTGAACTYGI